MTATEAPPNTLKTATVSWEVSRRFRARTGSGHDIVLDDVTGDAGPRPVELLIAALAGCTAMDVISILEKKRQAVSHYEVQVMAEQRQANPRVFTQVDVVHLVEGPDIDERAVRRAIELSATRYCTANATLSAGVSAIHHGYRIHRTGASGDADLAGHVVSTGPHADPDRLEGHLKSTAVTRDHTRPLPTPDRSGA